MRCGRAIRIWPDNGDVKEVEYLAFMHPDFGKLPEFPNLKAMFSRSAGVEAFIHHPKMPKVPLGKIEPPGGDPMMTEYVLMHVLRFHREMPKYQAAQARREWMRVPIVRPEQRRVGFLGYGMMAKPPALVLQSLGFPVSAWVRSAKPAAEVPIFYGRDQLAAFLGQTDIAVCLAVGVLPTRRCHVIQQRLDSVADFQNKYQVIDDVIKKSGPTSKIQQLFASRPMLYPAQTAEGGITLSPQQAFVRFIDNQGCAVFFR